MPVKYPLFFGNPRSIPLHEIKRGAIIGFKHYREAPETRRATRPYLGFVHGMHIEYSENEHGALEGRLVGLKVLLLEPFPYTEHIPNDKSHLMISDISTKQEMGLDTANNYRLNYDPVIVPITDLAQKFQYGNIVPQDLGRIIFDHGFYKLSLGSSDSEIKNKASQKRLDDLVGSPLFTEKQIEYIKEKSAIGPKKAFAILPELPLKPPKNLDEYEKLYLEVVIETNGELDQADPEKLKNLIDLHRDVRRKGSEQKRKARTQSKSTLKRMILHEREGNESRINSIIKAKQILDNSPDSIPSLLTLECFHTPELWKAIHDRLEISNIEDFYFLDQNQTNALRNTVLKESAYRRLEFLRILDKFGVDYLGEEEPEKSVLNLISTHDQATSIKEQHPDAYMKAYKLVVSSPDIEHAIAELRNINDDTVQKYSARLLISAFYLHAEEKGLVKTPQTPKEEITEHFQQAAYDIKLESLASDKANILDDMPLFRLGLPIEGSGQKPLISKITQAPLIHEGKQVVLETVRDAYNYIASLSDKEDTKTRKKEIIEELQNINFVGEKTAEKIYDGISKLFNQLKDFSPDNEEAELYPLYREGYVIEVAPR